MAKSKLTLSVSDLETRLSSDDLVLVMMDRLTHGAVLSSVERLLWQATWARGEETEGLAVGERAHDQLMDIVNLEQMINLLQCICDGVSGASIAEYYAGSEERAISPYGVTYPNEIDNPGEPLYGSLGVADWTAAKSKKCQLSQWWVSEMIGVLTWFVDNQYTNQEAIFVLGGALEALMGQVAVPAGWLLDSVSAVNGAILTAAEDARDDMVAKEFCYVGDIFLADTPQVAAASIKNRYPLFPMPEILIAYLLHNVFVGVKGADQLEIDVSGFDGSLCQFGSGVWTYCAGALLSPSQDYFTDLEFSTSNYEGVEQLQVQFDTPVTVRRVYSLDGEFNLNGNALPLGCAPAGWDHFRTSQDDYGFQGDTSPFPEPVSMVRMFGPPAGWTVHMIVEPC